LVNALKKKPLRFCRDQSYCFGSRDPSLDPMSSGLARASVFICARSAGLNDRPGDLTETPL
jgi:hypothetical protein